MCHATRALTQIRLQSKLNGMAKQRLAGDDPRAELSRTRDLARGVRRSQRATWFPLLVFAVLTFVSVPVTFAGHIVRTKCQAVADGLPVR